jgi:hypothetical protein
MEIVGAMFAAGGWAFLMVFRNFNKRIVETEKRLATLPCEEHLTKILEMAGDMKAVRATCTAINDTVNFLRNQK